MEIIALIGLLVGSSLLTGLGMASYLFTIARTKTLAWISLTLSVISLVGTFFFISVDFTQWFTHMAWPWITGVVIGFILIKFIGDDGDEDEATQS